MHRRFHPALYVILPLAVIGFASRFEAILYSLAIPLLVIIVLFAIYMISQRRSLRPRRVDYLPPRQERKRPDKFKTKRKHTVNATFRVIEGRKNRSDDEPPRYH
jgi:hypothetical protein